jgi:hypothetical protein
MFKFVYEPDEPHHGTEPRIELVLHFNEAHTDTLFEVFESYLLACGIDNKLAN